MYEEYRDVVEKSGAVEQSRYLTTGKTLQGLMFFVFFPYRCISYTYFLVQFQCFVSLFYLKVWVLIYIIHFFDVS